VTEQVLTKKPVLSWLEEDRLHEECGVFGIFNHPDAAALTALGLHALQHRGQEAAGIVSFDGSHFHTERRVGLVGDHFTSRPVIDRLKGDRAIGHVRYSTCGDPVLRNVQPLFVDLDSGGFALGHNGNLTNALTLRESLIKKGAICQSTTDTEVILHLVARSEKQRFVEKFIEALLQVEGAYALVGLTHKKLIGARDPGYDMSQFTWVGAVAKDVGLCMALNTTPFKTIDDVRQQQMVVAGTGAGSETDTWPVVLNEVLGTKFKLVTGYLGSQETIIAIERGEAHGRCVFSYSALKTAKPDWLRDKKINVLLLTALEPHRDFPGVPPVVELAKTPADRQLVELLVGPTAMARPFTAPPGVPAPIATLLRRAFDATMKDPEFLADAGKIQADVQPTTGEDVQRLVARLYQTPRPVVERVKKLLAP